MNKSLNPIEKKKLKSSQIGMTISLILVLLPVILIMMCHFSDSLVKWLGVFVVLMVLPILYFSWGILKIAYKDQKDVANPPLWVPKVYGFGISVNPYNRFGKLIMWCLVIFIIGLAIYIMQTPDYLIKH
ncbi:hypothetical protein JMK98_06955 [Pediococcus pentosaceus]|jgi:uncharacterized membrane protein|uniref:hypothetical protein n=1 Tax=Pediococcus pentosaceus TaxID=1255 RepID=UPI001964D44D|nr:hypothetical protein [Pediococcus pentosaceus]MBM9930221.1 hypothetical protein [Pediococcus pentosaceus]